MSSEKEFTNISNGGPITVTVEDGVITRVRPMVIEEKDYHSWTIQARGKNFAPTKKINVSPTALMERVRVYSDDRIKYPMKRIDFDPNGDRHPENRGKSGYVRITWDEALDIVSSEMKRVQATYGAEAISAVTSSHHNCGLVGYRGGPFARFFNRLGYTAWFDNPDSWEGWHWGATHHFGFYWRLGSPETYDLLEDTLQNSELMVMWSNDPDSTRGGYCGQESAQWRLWLKQLGIKMIFIDPFCNYTAGPLADKWIAPRVGTDSALALAIAYIWIKEDTYDKDYIAKRTTDFDTFKKYVMGEEDGIPKTPAWAEKKTDVPARVITALAREWASKRTVIACGSKGAHGGAMRQAYGHEWARLMVYLGAMQGLGKPGVSFWTTNLSAPCNTQFNFPGYADPEGKLSTSPVAGKCFPNPVTQKMYRLLFPEAILNPPVKWVGEGFCGKSLEQQFIPYVYPKPGTSEIKMFYRYGGSFLGTMTETNKWVQAYQSPKLECVVNQDCWWGGETLFADVVLPACTNLERNDIQNWVNSGGYGSHGYSGCNHRVIVYMKKCIEPVGESKSDYQIFALLAERMGFKDDYTDGKTEEDWIRAIFDYSDLPKYITFEEFEKKGYFVVPFPDDYMSTPTMRWFYEGRTCDTPDPHNPKRGTDKGDELGTYSGKIEFVSQSLTKYFPDDEERPVMARYIPSWEGPESELAKKYPLQLLSPHVRYSYHTHFDKHVEWMGEIPGHRVFKNGYAWWVARIHPSDAAIREIKEGDIIKLYNDRGAVLCIAHVTERCRPGVVHSYACSGKYDPVEPGKAYSIDRGGCVNLLTPARMLSQNAPGMAPNSCLIEVSKWEDE